jgi:hypothetical protein
LEKRILVVHGYGFVDSQNLGIQSEIVCKKVLAIHENYDRIYLLSGWHSKDLPDYLTSSDLMMNWLERNGVSNYKMHGLALLRDRCQIPRDTMEEAGLLLYFFKIFGHPADQEFDAVGLWYHAPRIDSIYHSRGLNCRKVIPAFSWQTLKPNQWSRIVQEPPGLLLTCWDPYGQGDFFKKLREQRTHYKTKNPVTM